MQDQYTIIFNPQRILLKNEVWFKGRGIGQDSRGFAVDIDVKRKLKSFRTAEQAEGFIKYQQEVAAFVGGDCK
jgi:hypothetical protein